MFMISFSHPKYSSALPGSITAVLSIWSILLMQQSADEQGISVYSTEHIYQVLAAKPFSVMNSIQIPAHLALKTGKRKCTGQKEACVTYHGGPHIRCVHTLSITSLTTLQYYSSCSVCLYTKIKKPVPSLSLVDGNRYKERLQRMQKPQIS